MLASRIRLAEQLVDDGEESRELTDELSCDCLWFRRWLLPCEHVFQHQLLLGVMTPQYWRDLSHTWEESGFEVYEASEELAVDRELASEVTAPARRKLQVREICDSIKECYYSLEEQIKELELEGPDVDNAINYWITGLTKATGSLIQQSIREVVAGIPRLERSVDTYIHNSELAAETHADEVWERGRNEEVEDDDGESDSGISDGSSTPSIKKKGQDEDHPMLIDDE